MILARLRNNLEIMLSPLSDRPGLLIRDRFRYSDVTLIIPPRLIGGLQFFDGTRTDIELQAELARSSESLEILSAVGQLMAALSEAGFLEDEIFHRLRERRLLAFTRSPVRHAAHAGSSY